MTLRNFWPLWWTLLLPSFTLASTGRPILSDTNIEPLAIRERQLRRDPVHNSEFADVPHTTARSRCEKTHPPEALTTPNPVLGGSDPAIKVKVSFIVGADGRVHSPFILESAGTAEDHGDSGDRPNLALSPSHVQRRPHRDRRQDRVFEPLAGWLI